MAPSSTFKNDRALRSASYLPRSEDARWVSYGGNGGLGNSWTDISPYGSAALPPPPRPPRLAALMDRANNLGLSSSYYGRDDYYKRDVHHFDCWRLRWCALCLVIAVALQASTVGSKLQAFYGANEPHAPSATADVIGALACRAERTHAYTQCRRMYFPRLG